MILLTFAILVGQDAAVLIDRLRSERPEEREEAVERLLELGELARTHLEKAKEDTDVEVAARARDILSRLRLRASLGNLLKSMPTLDRNLLGAKDAVWTEAFLRATDQEGTRRAFPALRREDVEVLALRALRGASPELAPNVLKRIQAWHLRSAAPEILPFLQASESQQRSDAVRLLRTLGAVEMAPRLLEAFKSEKDSFAARELLGTLVEWGQRALLPELRRRLNAKEGEEGNDSRRNEDFAVALGALGDPSDMPLLLGLIGDLERRVSHGTIARALAQIDPDGAIELLIKKARRDPKNVDYGCLVVLCEMPTRKILPELRKMLFDQDHRARGDALNALVGLQDRDSIPELNRLLRHDDRWTRLGAARALAFLGDGAGVPILREELKDTQLRETTIYPLYCVDARNVLPDLLEILRSGDGRPAGILARQGGEEWTRKFMPLRADAPAHFRKTVAHGLLSAGHPDALPLLTILLSEGDASDRNGIAETLGQLGRPESKEALLKACREAPDGCSHYPALRFLGRVGGRDVIPEILPYLDHSQYGRRREALIALEEAGGREHLDRVRALLTDSDAWVATQAAAWLAREGSTDGVFTLLGSDWPGRFALNALRKPTTWKKLGTVCLTPPHQTWGYRGLEELANQLGLRLVLPAEGRMPHLYLPLTARDGLEALATSDVVLEDDAIRILAPVEAKRFWREWWEARK